MHQFDPFAVIATILLLSAAAAQARREWGAAPMSKLFWHRVWALRWVFCVVIGSGFFFYSQWSEKIGFSAKWPDAIRCHWIEPPMVNPSEMIFYYQGTVSARPFVGEIAVYFFVGGANYKDEHGEPYYFPHQLWFSTSTGALITPDKLSTQPHPQLLTYKKSFLNGINCGGDSMEQIKKENAFIFARPVK